MFEPRAVQPANLETASRAFCDTLRSLPDEVFLAPLGDWTPRDFAAHFVGWNRITPPGSAELREGVLPFYFHNGTNDRKVNATDNSRYAFPARDEMLAQIESTLGERASHLHRLPEGEWEPDTGVAHYRPGPATVARGVDSLLRHRDEILAGASTAG